MPFVFSTCNFAHANTIQATRQDLSTDHVRLAELCDDILLGLTKQAKERVAVSQLLRKPDQPERIFGSRAAMTEGCKTPCSAGPGSSSVLVIENGVDGNVILGVSTINRLVWLHTADVNPETSTAALWCGHPGLHGLMGAPESVQPAESPLLQAACTMLVAKFAQLLSCGQRTEFVRTDVTGNPVVRLVPGLAWAVDDLLEAFHPDEKLNGLLKLCKVPEAVVFLSGGGEHTLLTSSCGQLRSATNQKGQCGRGGPVLSKFSAQTMENHESEKPVGSPRSCGNPHVHAAARTR